ncbi:MAG TPA: class I SAM-dependent methyltransferase [Actinophytocola sp.]|jgi:SAM-dependent methyltransferase|nr:class I SAM-dependent methyltransferase [Actinophytocola sp.]
MDTTAIPLLGSLRGTVLELGPGAGRSLRHYAPDVRWIGVEPDARHRARVRGEADRLGRGARVLPGRAERLDLPDASVDAVVATFVLCSVADQAAALAELVRVLRPGGRFVFAEHVAARRGTWLRRAQHVWAAFGPCRPDRDTLPAVERAGLDVVELRSYTRPGPFGAAIPHIAGAALRPAHERKPG